MPPVNVLIMIHGMSPSEEPQSPFNGDGKVWGYNQFWEALCREEPELLRIFPTGFIGVEWGHELPNTPAAQLREDQRLTRAQNFVNDRVGYDRLVKDPGPNNHTMSLFGSRGADFPLLSPVIRSLVVGLRESIITRGFGDVIYYSSKEGEDQVRRVVYGQALKQLEDYVDQPDVRLHLIGQSLGVTLTHDFLYGLFAPNHQPGFYKQGDLEDVERFKVWRKKVENGELKLGSLTSTASQLPLFTMRKQKLIDLLAAGKPLDAKDIGITNTSRVKWQIFYDVDDLLGFGTRRLYDAGDAIAEYQVDSDDNPGKAHTRYWENKTVIRETAKLLLTNAQAA